jgi:hypothetical protein
MARIRSIARKLPKYKRSSERFNETLQKHKDEYLRETQKVLVTTRELAVWAIATGRWEPPPDLALRKCREDYSRALHEEYIKDTDGQPVRVNQAARQREGDRQTTFWGDIRTIPRSHMEASSAQRREQIVGECRQLDRDERYYNGQHSDEPPLQSYFNFMDDVNEGRFSGALEDIGTIDDDY